MAISFKKISEMIEIEVNKIKNLSDSDSKKLMDLCKKIYTLKISGNYSKRGKYAQDIMAEISRASVSIRAEDI